MTQPHADDLIAAHEIKYTGRYTDDCPYTCTCGFTGTQDEAWEHARENGLCGTCHGSGEGDGPFYGGDDSGIGPCDGCRGGRTVEAQNATMKAAAELDAVRAQAEQVELKPRMTEVPNPPTISQFRGRRRPGSEAYTILRYLPPEGVTMDMNTYLWQGVARKAALIEQVMSGATVAEAGEPLDFAQVIAAGSDEFVSDLDRHAFLDGFTLREILLTAAGECTGEDDADLCTWAREMLTVFQAGDPVLTKVQVEHFTAVIDAAVGYLAEVSGPGFTDEQDEGDRKRAAVASSRDQLVHAVGYLEVRS